MLPYLKKAPLKKDVTNKIKISSIGGLFRHFFLTRSNLVLYELQ